MSELFECFPYIQNEHLIIKKMTEDDLDALEEMTSNANLYRYVPPFLYKKVAVIYLLQSETSVAENLIKKER